MNLYTIGFTGKSARDFFETLRDVDAKYLLDVRVRNNSQLASFTKKGNIEFLTEELTPLTYREAPVLAPEEELFKQYRADKDWALYEERYITLLKERNAATEVDPELFEGGAVLLCSEPTPERCHRRLAAEYLKDEQLLKEACIIHI